MKAPAMTRDNPVKPSEHTPGPWVLECGERGHRFSRVYSAYNGHPIHYKYASSDGASADQDVRNARLIAAAPTMADYLRELAAAGDERAATIMEAINATGAQR